MGTFYIFVSTFSTFSNTHKALVIKITVEGLILHLNNSRMLRVIAPLSERDWKGYSAIVCDQFGGGKTLTLALALPKQLPWISLDVNFSQIRRDAEFRNESTDMKSRVFRFKGVRCSLAQASPSNQMTVCTGIKCFFPGLPSTFNSDPRIGRVLGEPVAVLDEFSQVFALALR